MLPKGTVSGHPDVYSKCLAGFQHRLLPDDARPLHFLDVAGAIGDHPVAVTS